MDKEKQLKELLIHSALDPKVSMITASMVRERKFIKLVLDNGVRFEFPEDATVVQLGQPIKGSDEAFHTFDLLQDDMNTFATKLQVWALPCTFYFILDVTQKVFVEYLSSSFTGGLARMFSLEKICVPDTVIFFISLKHKHVFVVAFVEERKRHRSLL